MTSLKQVIFGSIFSLLVLPQAWAAGYTQNIYLCDLGIMNPDLSNAQGVDFVEYLQNGQTTTVKAGPAAFSAANFASTQIPGFDRWNPTFGIDNVYFGFASEYFGTTYYLEYCYTWDRVAPFDTLEYTTTVSAALPMVVPNTTLGVDSKCSVLADSGIVTNRDFPQSIGFQTLLAPSEISMRCTVRLTFAEDSLGMIPRPHQYDLDALNPQVNVKVVP